MSIREKITDAVISYMHGLPEPKELPQSISVEIHFNESREKHSITIPHGEGKSESVSSAVDELVKTYNEICGIRLPKVRIVTERRKKSLSVRLRERSLAEFKELFEKTAASDFLCGSNDRNWCANFDWLINETNMAKVLEGNFDNRSSVTTRAGTHTATSFDVDESLKKAMERSYGK